MASKRPAPTSVAALVDAPRVLALLVQAQQALADDPGLARHHLDHLSLLLHRACGKAGTGTGKDRTPEAGGGPALLAMRPAYKPPATGGLAAWQTRRVTEHVDRHLARNIRADDLARAANLSTGHFCRAFKVSIGETPHSYVIRQRVRRAQLMMLETADNLSEIASACGLADQAHLTRLFKRMVGATPLVWRRSWQASSDPAGLACGSDSPRPAHRSGHQPA